MLDRVASGWRDVARMRIIVNSIAQKAGGAWASPPCGCFPALGSVPINTYRVTGRKWPVRANFGKKGDTPAMAGGLSDAVFTTAGGKKVLAGLMISPGWRLAISTNSLAHCLMMSSALPVPGKPFQVDGPHRGMFPVGSHGQGLLRIGVIDPRFEGHRAL